MEHKSTNSPIDPNQYSEELRTAPEGEPPVEIITETLKKNAKKRAKKPLIKKITSILKPSKRKPFRELIINAEPIEKRVTQLVDGVLEKFDVERVGEQRMIGSIFKGRIQNLDARLKAAFIDIGEQKNAFLHYWDINPGFNDASIEFVRENKTDEQKRLKKKISQKDIERIYPVGEEIIIQITKSQIGSKGPRSTTNISIPGRFIVLMPNYGQCGISRQIENPKERDRLKRILKELSIPEGMGIIIRTAGEGKKACFFARDLQLLLEKWEEVRRKIQSKRNPALVYQEPNIIERTVRDFLTEDIDRILVDNQEDHDNILEAVAQVSPRSKNKISLFDEDIPIFERFNIERQIEQTYQRKVPLPSGGEIAIEETEALIAIDVNTGSHKTKNEDNKEYILQCNIEAAREAARQIHLRNIGGLIIIDFIDMKDKRHRKTVLDTMRKVMAKDKAKSNILPISPLGIMQMTRQRQKESLSSGLHISCPYCKGRGNVKSPHTMAIEIQRRLTSGIRQLRTKDDTSEINIQILLHPTSLSELRKAYEQILVDLEKHYGISLSFLSDENYHVENFKIIHVQSGCEIQ